MKRAWLPACGLLILAGCGGVKPEAELEEQLDPYRAPMARRINEVLYGSDKPGKIVQELDLLGIRSGIDFGDFKEATGIDDWFSEPWGYDQQRHTSLTCGLSPVVAADGKIVGLFRSRKVFDGSLHRELRLSGDRDR